MTADRTLQDLVFVPAHAGSGGLLDARLRDPDVFQRAVTPVPLDPADPIHDLHPLEDLPEHGMLPVEGPVVDRVDEELAPARVGPGVRHRQRAADVPVLRSELVLDRVAGPAHPGARRVPALDHEVRDYPMEDRPVVEPLLHELPEAPGRQGHRPLEQVDPDRGHRRPESPPRPACRPRLAVAMRRARRRPTPYVKLPSSMPQEDAVRRNRTVAPAYVTVPTARITRRALPSTLQSTPEITSVWKASAT